MNSKDDAARAQWKRQLQAYKRKLEQFMNNKNKASHIDTVLSNKTEQNQNIVFVK
jgi:hypothetical protein